LQTPHWHAKAWHSEMFPLFQKIKLLRWGKKYPLTFLTSISKLIVQVLQQSIVENTSLSLVFYVILGQISFINCCIEVNFSLRFCLKISLLTSKQWCFKKKLAQILWQWLTPNPLQEDQKAFNEGHL
jgi:hypothetical protein